jgi:hypothetical protein
MGFNSGFKGLNKSEELHFLPLAKSSSLAHSFGIEFDVSVGSLTSSPTEIQA